MLVFIALPSCWGHGEEKLGGARDSESGGAIAPSSVLIEVPAALHPIGSNPTAITGPETSPSTPDILQDNQEGDGFPKNPPRKPQIDLGMPKPVAMKGPPLTELTLKNPSGARKGVSFYALVIALELLRIIPHV